MIKAKIFLLSALFIGHRLLFGQNSSPISREEHYGHIGICEKYVENNCTNVRWCEFFPQNEWKFIFVEDCFLRFRIISCKNKSKENVNNLDCRVELNSNCAEKVSREIIVKSSLNLTKTDPCLDVEIFKEKIRAEVANNFFRIHRLPLQLEVSKTNENKSAPWMESVLFLKNKKIKGEKFLIPRFLLKSGLIALIEGPMAGDCLNYFLIDLVSGDIFGIPSSTIFFSKKGDFLLSAFFSFNFEYPCGYIGGMKLVYRKKGENRLIFKLASNSELDDLMNLVFNKILKPKGLLKNELEKSKVGMGTKCDIKKIVFGINKFNLWCKANLSKISSSNLHSSVLIEVFGRNLMENTKLYVRRLILCDRSGNRSDILRVPRKLSLVNET